MILALAILLMSNWIELSTDVNGAVWSVNVDSIKDVKDGYNGDVRKVWVNVDHSRDKTVSYRQTKKLFFFKCVEEKAKIVTYVIYEADGTVRSSNSPSYSSYEPVVPDSVLSGVFQPVCGLDLE